MNRVRATLWRLSMVGLARGPHITRYSMYRTLSEVGARLDPKKGQVLSISHSNHLGEIMGLPMHDVCEANYPEHSLLSLGFEDAAFDFVIADQVLEHVEGNPQQAIDECSRVLRSGGILVLTSCLINPIHDRPLDFWRFTPGALRLLCAGLSEIVECDGWGNFQAWGPILDGIRFDGVPNAAWHPLNRLALKNDPDWPIVTWIVARK